MLRQRGKQLSVLVSQTCLHDEERHLSNQSANIHLDQAANSQQTQATNPEENTEHLKKKSSSGIDS